MRKVYVCILGNWACLNDDPNCRIMPGNLTPDQWLENRTPIYSPSTPNKEHCYDQLPYIEFVYMGNYFEIPWPHIQIANYNYQD